MVAPGEAPALQPPETGFRIGRQRQRGAELRHVARRRGSFRDGPYSRDAQRHRPDPVSEARSRVRALL